MTHNNGTSSAIVIGAGFGGLALANRLQSAGFDVSLFEGRDSVGGRAYQLRDAGYTFDMGPTLITAPDIINAIFERAGRTLDDYLTLQPLDPYYRVLFHDGSTFDYSGDEEAMLSQIERFEPADAIGYRRYMDAARPIYEAVIGDGLGASAFDTVGSMLRFAPRALRLGAHRSVYSLAARHFKDFRHRFVFSFHPLFIGGDPFNVPAIYAMIPYLEKEQGVWYTRGGMYSLVRALHDLFVDQGGSVFTGRPVDRILVEQGRAVGVEAGGQRFSSDVVASNADIGHTYGQLLPPGASRRWRAERLSRVDHTMSCFLLYLGVRRKYDGLAHHTILLSEPYRELVRDIFDRKVLPQEFSTYVHAPSRTDSSMAPGGCESIYALVPVPNLESGIDWTTETEPFTERVLDMLEERLLPGLRADIETMHVFTPLDFETTLNASVGNAFGIEPKLLQTAYFRPHNRSEDVERLYLVGAGTHPGAGVPGVLLGAEATEKCIRQDVPGALPQELDLARATKTTQRRTQSPREAA